MDFGQALLIGLGVAHILVGVAVLLSRGGGWLESQMVTVGPKKTKAVLASVRFLVAILSILGAFGIEVV